MRHSITLAIGLARDPLLILAFAAFIAGAVIVAVISVTLAGRARLKARPRIIARPLQTQPSST